MEEVKHFLQGSFLNKDGNVGLNRIYFVVLERSQWNLQEVGRLFLPGACIAIFSLTNPGLPLPLPSKSNAVVTQ